MNREQFIATLFEMYPNSFTTNNMNSWANAYSNVLPENIDFQELFDDMLTNYQKNVAPAPAFFTPFVAKQKERLKAKSEINKSIEQQKQWEQERKELEKNDKPVTTILKPLEVLERAGLPVTTPFTDKQLKVMRNYAYSIPNIKFQCEFFKEICKVISERGILR